MRSTPLRIIVVLLLLLGGYIWLDPGHPTSTEALAAINRSGIAGANLSSARIDRSFVGRHSKDGPSVRVWPVTVTGMPTGSDAVLRQAQDHFYYLWKKPDGQWQAEADQLVTQWESLGYFGFFGL